MESILLEGIEFLGVAIDIKVHYKEEYNPVEEFLTYHIVSIFVVPENKEPADISNLLTPEIRACIEQEVYEAVLYSGSADEVDYAGDLS